jgi:hypothetical protein
VRRVVCIALLVAVACNGKRRDDHPHPDPPAATVAPAAPADLPVVPVVPLPPAAVVDAEVADPPELGDPVETRLQRYAELLAIDFAVYQIVNAFPGVPPTTTFATSDYRWRIGGGSAFEDITHGVGDALGVVASASGSALQPVDVAVADYAHALADWLPELAELHAYYDDNRYVDDEFARARREQPELAKHAAAIARLRVPMRAAVEDAWRKLVAAHPASPRGVVDRAWQACMTVADRAMAGASDDALASAVSGCRASIQPIVDLGTSSDFADDVRAAAIELGDWVAQHHPTWNAQPSRALATLTEEYDQLWPTLPADPPEKP